jgi:hypothetical protein
MSDRGYIAVDRGIFDHPVFAPEAFTEREAWIWMIAEAAWRPCTVRVGRSLVQVGRGQFVHSLRFMATRWRWSEARVRRFLGRLSDRRTGDALIVVLATHEATQITICNYDKYQDGRRTGDAPSDAPPDAKPTQRRTNNQEPVTREDTSLRSVSPPTRKIAPAVRPDDGFPADAFDRWYGAFPRHTGRGHAEKAFAAMRRRGDVQFDALMDATRRFARSPPDPQFCPHPATWLNGKRYLDEPEPSLFANGRIGSHVAGHRPARTSPGDAIAAGVAAVEAAMFGRDAGAPDDPRVVDLERSPEGGYRAAAVRYR